MGSAAAPQPAKPKRARRTGTTGISISPDERVALYSSARFLPTSLEQKTGVKLPFTTFFQDPFVAKQNPTTALDEKVYVNWEPNLSDGPTSARFAVVDFNGDTGTLELPAKWDEPTKKFVFDGKQLNSASTALFQFHEVNVWALLQRGLE